MTSNKLKVAAFQFHDSNNIENNLAAIERGIKEAENAKHLISVNRISNQQFAPTCVINPDGMVLQAAPRNEECLLA